MLRFMDSFEFYSTADILKKYALAGPAAVISAGTGRRGGASLRLPQSGVYAPVVRRPMGANIQTVIVGFAVKFSAFSAAVPFLRFEDAGVGQVDITVTTGGNLRADRSDVAVLGTSASALTVGTYAYIEVKVKIASSPNGTVEVRVNGALFLLVTGVSTRVTANEFLNAITFVGGSGAGPSIDVDDYYICDDTGTLNNTFRGDSRVDAFLPSGDDYTDFNPDTVNALTGTWTWAGPSLTVAATDTSQVVAGDYIRLDSDGQWFPIASINPNVSVTITNPRSLTIPSGATGSSRSSGHYTQVDDPTSPDPGAAVQTTLTGTHDATTTTITVASTSAFPAATAPNAVAGTIQIENELITYTAKTGTTFTVATRGAFGSTPASHAGGVAVQLSTFVQQSGLNAKDAYHVPNLASASQSIFGVQVNAATMKDDAGVKEIATIVHTSAGDAVGTNVALGTAMTYLSQVHETQPVTLAAWTNGAFADATFGIKIVAT